MNEIADEPFWRTRRLDELTDAEWESLCDGCGQCCLHVFDVEEMGMIQVPVACRLLELETCRCSDYANRQDEVPSCIVLTPATVRDYSWLPSTCAYRRLDEGRDLPIWHPLRTGDPASTLTSGHAVRDRAVSERDSDPWDALVEMLEQR